MSQLWLLLFLSFYIQFVHCREDDAISTDYQSANSHQHPLITVETPEGTKQTLQQSLADDMSLQQQQSPQSLQPLPYEESPKHQQQQLQEAQLRQRLDDELSPVTHQFDAEPVETRYSHLPQQPLTATQSAVLPDADPLTATQQQAITSPLPESKESSLDSAELAQQALRAESGELLPRQLDESQLREQQQLLADDNIPDAASPQYTDIHAFDGEPQQQQLQISDDYDEEGDGPMYKGYLYRNRSELESYWEPKKGQKPEYWANVYDEKCDRRIHIFTNLNQIKELCHNYFYDELIQLLNHDNPCPDLNLLIEKIYPIRDPDKKPPNHETYHPPKQEAPYLGWIIFARTIFNPKSGTEVTSREIQTQLDTLIIEREKEYYYDLGQHWWERRGDETDDEIGERVIDFMQFKVTQHGEAIPRGATTPRGIVHSKWGIIYPQLFCYIIDKKTGEEYIEPVWAPNVETLQRDTKGTVADARYTETGFVTENIRARWDENVEHKVKRCIYGHMRPRAPYKVTHKQKEEQLPNFLLRDNKDILIESHDISKEEIERLRREKEAERSRWEMAEE